MKTRIVILGATGSVGGSVASVIAEHRERFQVEAVVGGSNPVALARTARNVGARFAAIADPAQGEALKGALADIGLRIDSGAGTAAVDEAVDRDCELVVAAIAGTAGLRPTHRAIRPGRRIALANKETLVCAGDAFMRDAHAAGVTVLPLDSEHNALWQALGGASVEEIESMILTASGGPFLHWSAEAIAAATPEQALKHPNYAMGAKISIDSATMMNKGLEVIEAHHLFAIAPTRLQVLVHPQQIVHGLVSFADGSVVAGMAAPDMRIPAAHCLGIGSETPPRTKSRLATSLPRLDLAAIGRLDFASPDTKRFPALALALDALAAGGGLPTVLNAANEIAVEAFLRRRINFGDIVTLARQACDFFTKNVNREPESIEAAIEIDQQVRDWARSRLEHDPQKWIPL
ncbi:1-deoxy-D-xylulose-5-phosphate reductoisomerase [Pseudochelatococcus sp. B33]